MGWTLAALMWEPNIAHVIAFWNNLDILETLFKCQTQQFHIDLPIQLAAAGMSELNCVQLNRSGVDIQRRGIGIPVICNVVWSIGPWSSERHREGKKKKQTHHSLKGKEQWEMMQWWPKVPYAWTKIFGVTLDFSLSYRQFLGKFLQLCLHYLSDHFMSTISPGLKHCLLLPLLLE